MKEEYLKKVILVLVNRYKQSWCHVGHSRHFHKRVINRSGEIFGNYFFAPILLQTSCKDVSISFELFQNFILSH